MFTVRAVFAHGRVILTGAVPRAERKDPARTPLNPAESHHRLKVRRFVRCGRVRGKMPHPGTKVGEGNCKLARDRLRKWKTKWKKMIVCAQPGCQSCGPRPLTNGRAANLPQKLKTTPRNDGTGLACISASPAHNWILPRLPEGLFRIPEKLPNQFYCALYCCKLKMFLYIGGYTGCVQSKFGSRHPAELAVCSARFSGYTALLAGAL